MKARRNSSRAGFSLVELLATLVLMTLVLLLLFRGFQAVSDAVIRGGRQSGLDRELHTGLNLLREDLEQMRVTEQTPFVAEIRNDEDENGNAYAILSFLRVQNQASPLYDREYVQYWIEPHVDRDYLKQLVRYAGYPDPESHEGEDESPMTDPPVNFREQSWVTSEIIIDHLIKFQLHFPTPSEDDESEPSMPQVWSVAPGYFDIALGLCREPLPPLIANISLTGNLYKDVDTLDGTWGRIRTHPRVQGPPDAWEETP
ncbi:MAG: prepilin-type N-terminal cleavage/methylation domain-containing protein [Kiritimatiellae bacterium]|nr:prepilin-type N-terminal cleavage/methylation domain-containing protein [Kiritimatiellia bacterium]